MIPSKHRIFTVTLCLLLVVSISSNIQTSHAGSGTSIDDPIVATLGVNNGTLTAGGEVYFIFTADSSKLYEFALSAVEIGDDFDMYLYGKSDSTYTLLDSVNSTANPDVSKPIVWNGDVIINVTSAFTAEEGDFDLIIKETAIPVEMMYSDSLAKGDEFFWDITEFGDIEATVDLGIPIEDGTQLTMEVLKDELTVPITTEVLEIDISSLFSFSAAGEPIEDIEGGLPSVFVVPTTITLSNGTQKGTDFFAEFAIAGAFPQLLEFGALNQTIGINATHTSLDMEIRLVIFSVTIDIEIDAAWLNSNGVMDLLVINITDSTGTSTAIFELTEPPAPEGDDDKGGLALSSYMIILGLAMLPLLRRRN